MSDPTPESNLTPAQDDAVRALLASARHTDPIPPDVVARLDAALASLGEERRELRPESRAPVVTLASRRRRTTATALLAAAAVVVFGVGIGQVLPSMTTSGEDSGSAGSAPESSSLAEDRTSAESDSQDDAGAEPKEGAREMRSQDATAPTLGAVEDLSGQASDAELKAQVRALRPEAPFTSSFSTGPECIVEPAAPGDHVSVTYDARPGVLVYRVPVANRQRVDVYVCGQPGPARSVWLRAAP